MTLQAGTDPSTQSHRHSSKTQRSEPRPAPSRAQSGRLHRSKHHASLPNLSTLGNSPSLKRLGSEEGLLQRPKRHSQAPASTRKDSHNKKGVGRLQRLGDMEKLQAGARNPEDRHKQKQGAGKLLRLGSCEGLVEVGPSRQKASGLQPSPQTPPRNQPLSAHQLACNQVAPQAAEEVDMIRHLKQPESMAESSSSCRQLPGTASPSFRQSAHPRDPSSFPAQLQPASCSAEHPTRRRPSQPDTSQANVRLPLEAQHTSIRGWQSQSTVPCRPPRHFEEAMAQLGSLEAIAAGLRPPQV